MKSFSLIWTRGSTKKVLLASAAIKLNSLNTLFCNLLERSIPPLITPATDVTGPLGSVARKLNLSLVP